MRGGGGIRMPLLIHAHRPHVPHTTLRDMVAAIIAYPKCAVMLVPFALVGLAMRYL
jgi:hypothetical protein